MYNIENIDGIRRKAIVEIKEKVKKNPGYLHPCNKERLEYMKRLMFVSGNEFTLWMQKNGIMNSITDVERKRKEKVYKDAGCKTHKEYRDKCAQKVGFKNGAERYRDYSRERTHETGRNLPKEFNDDCASWFGEFTENLMIQTFECAIKMPYGNPGFDWTCKRGDNIDNKAACLQYIRYKTPFWLFHIRYNNITDWFILSAWDSRDSLKPLYVWAFHKNDIVREIKFWKREGFSITNTLEKLKELEKWEVTNRLDKLKEFCIQQ